MNLLMESDYTNHIAQCNLGEDVNKECKELYPGLEPNKAIFRARLDGILNAKEFCAARALV